MFRQLALIRLVSSASVLALSAVLLSACSSDSDDEFIETQFEDQMAGGAPPVYTEPIPVTGGDYLPADFPFEEVAQRGIAASQATGPAFRGRVGDFNIFPTQEYFDGSAGVRSKCQAAEFKPTVRLAFKYLPGGTYASSPQYEALCADGSLIFASQEFLTKHGRFTLSYRVGDKAIAHDAPAERIRQTNVSGRATLVIEPPVPEGFGASVFAMATGKGFVLLESVNLPTSESLKIMQGLTCEGC